MRDELLDWQAAAFFRLGESAQVVGEYSDAEDWYQRVLEVAPRHEATLFNLAVTRIRRRDPDGALDALRRLTQEIKGDGSAVPLQRAAAYNRALAHSYAGRHRKAREDATSLAIAVLSAEPSDPEERKFVHRLEGPVATLLAGAIVAEPEQGDSDPPARRLQRKDILDLVTSQGAGSLATGR